MFTKEEHLTAIFSYKKNGVEQGINERNNII